jgi:hypothetical protein
MHLYSRGTGRPVLVAAMGGDVCLSVFEADDVKTVLSVQAHESLKVNAVRATPAYVVSAGMDHEVKVRRRQLLHAVFRVACFRWG